MLIDAAYTELAVRTLHSLYGLDARGVGAKPRAAVSGARGLVTPSADRA